MKTSFFFFLMNQLAKL